MGWKIEEGIQYNSGIGSGHGGDINTNRWSKVELAGVEQDCIFVVKSASYIDE